MLLRRDHYQRMCEADKLPRMYSCVTPCTVTKHSMRLQSNPLQWRHNGRDGVSNQQPHDCIFNRLIRRRSKKTSKLRVTGLCAGNSPHKWPVSRKKIPFDDVVLQYEIQNVWVTYPLHDVPPNRRIPQDTKIYECIQWCELIVHKFEIVIIRQSLAIIRHFFNNCKLFTEMYK